MAVLLYRANKHYTKEEYLKNKRWEELREAEQALQDLKDKKQVANVDLSAAELETKIEKLKRKINKENNKHA